MSHFRACTVVHIDHAHYIHCCFHEMHSSHDCYSATIATPPSGEL